MFEDFRDQMSKLSSIDAEEILYKLASTYCDVGMIDAAIDTFRCPRALSVIDSVRPPSWDDSTGSAAC